MRENILQLQNFSKAITITRKITTKIKSMHIIVRLLAIVSFWILFHPQISNLAGMSAHQLPFSLSLSSNLRLFLQKFLYSFSNYVTTIVNLTGQASFKPIQFYPTKLFNMTFGTTTGISMAHH